MEKICLHSVIAGIMITDEIIIVFFNKINFIKHEILYVGEVKTTEFFQTC